MARAKKEEVQVDASVNEEVKPSDKSKRLDEVMKEIEKDFGKGAIIRIGSAPTEEVKVISTGSILIDRASGVKGFPRGRIVEIIGWESSGKTTLCLHTIAEAQKMGLTAAFIDAEHALDLKYAKNLGVDVDNLYMSQPSNGEQALAIVDKLTNSGSVDLIVVDSVAALVPQTEIDGEIGDAHMGLQARLMSQSLRILSGAISKKEVLVIFTNQWRSKIGVAFGDPRVTPGGLALKFYASMRCEISRVETNKEGEVSVSNGVKIKFIKNKVAPPYTVAETKIVFGKGFDVYSELLDLGVEFGIIEKAGSWFSYGEERIGQGSDKACEFIKSNKELQEKIKTKALETKAPEGPTNVEG